MIHQQIRNIFIELFSTDPHLFYSPGRINLLGEHTDYNMGFVLPAAIDKKIIMAISKNDLKIARMYSVDFEEEFAFDLHSFGPKKGHWATYIMGVVAQLQQAGYYPEGFDIVFGGDIPVGAGLSSSAALECVTGYALSQLFDFKIPSQSLIQYAQKAEHIFAGVQCGIMDQFASVMGKKDHVIRLDCRSLEYDYFPMSLNDYQLLLVDSGVKHSLASSAYNQRREECLEGVKAAKELFPELNSLRDMDIFQLQQIDNKIDPIVYQRCKYVIEENNRVLEATEFLIHNNLEQVGQLMYATHEGLSREYEVSCKELDFLVNQTKPLDYVLGSRMMGGGFGGCTLNLLKKNKIDDFKEKIQRTYQEQFDIYPEIYEVLLSDGTGSI
jgi:galactokinase